jgi:hypothetical protein
MIRRETEAMGGADHSEDWDARADAASHPTEERGVDRSHNRDTLSSEAMTEMLRDLQDAMLALDQRLGALEASKDIGPDNTRRLAQGVVDLGDALTRRVRALEQGRQTPPPILIRRESSPPARARRARPGRHRLAWAAGLVFVLLIALGGFWLLNAESVDRATSAAAPNAVVAAPVVAAAPAPAPTPAPSAADTAPPRPPPPHTASHTGAPHRSAPWRSPAHTRPAPSAPSAPIGFSRYGPGPSAPVPAPSQPPPS